MSRFAIIPPVPFIGVPPWEVQTIGAMVQNVNLLTANQEPGSLTTQAALRSTYSVGDIVPTAIPVVMEKHPYNQLTAYGPISGNQGVLYNSNAASLPGLVSQCVLASDMDKMILEIADLRSAVNNIIQQLVK